jgi:hypothetical protein
MFAEESIHIFIRDKFGENVLLAFVQERKDLKKSLNHHNGSFRKFVKIHLKSISGIDFRHDEKNNDKIAKIGNAVFDEPFTSGSVVYHKEATT